MRSATRICSEPGCGSVAPRGGRCPSCRRQAERRRGTAASRGYGVRWAKNRSEFLRWFPVCVDCGGEAEVPDHDPIPRAELVRQGVADPDDWRYLRPRCKRCHNRRTATEDGGFGR